MSILVTWNVRNFKATQDGIVGSPCESVGWHHYIFVARVFLGPQIGDVEHISSTFLHLILHWHWGTGMPKNKLNKQ